MLAATIAAAAMIAQVVIGKATRDALFFSHFSAARLPVVLIAGSIVSGAVVWLTTRLLARFGPARVAPIVFAAQGVLVLVEWALAAPFEPQIALVFYVHMLAVNAMIVSVFWSVVGEGFDPHTAKDVIGRIGAGATLGGVLGGGIAWGASRVTTVPTMFGVMAALSGVCTWGVATLVRGTRASHHRPAQATVRASGLTALRQTPFLRLLAIVVLLGGLAQSLLDYALGAEAKATYGEGARLLAFFALFQTAVGVFSFLVHLATNRFASDRLGIGATMALLPGGVIACGALVLGVPSLVTVALQRGVDAILRASFFGSAYEVLFTPVPKTLKRATKTTIDVSFDRVGLAVGSALTLGILALFPHDALRGVIAAAVVAAAVQLVVIYRLHHGYIETLTDRLRSGVLVLDLASVVDATTRATLSRTLESLDRRTLLAQIETHSARAIAALKPAPEHPRLAPEPVDDVVRALADLRAPDAARIRRGLQGADAQRFPLTLSILDLLGRDDVARDAAIALAPLVPRIVGAILDVVLDPSRPPSARRRAARLLSTVSSQRTASALDLALDTEDLDVRCACSRTLLRMRETNSELRFDAAAILARARRELETGREGHARDALELEHTFNLLSLTFPREAMQLAYGAVFSHDPFLRGVALEYLDAMLPADLRAALTPRLNAATTRSIAAPRQGTRALDDLLQSKETIRASLDELRRAHDLDVDTPP